MAAIFSRPRCVNETDLLIYFILERMNAMGVDAQMDKWVYEGIGWLLSRRVEL